MVSVWGGECLGGERLTIVVLIHGQRGLFKLILCVFRLFFGVLRLNFCICMCFLFLLSQFRKYSHANSYAFRVTGREVDQTMDGPGSQRQRGPP